MKIIDIVICIAAVLTAGSIDLIDGKHVFGELTTKKNWKYLTRFCFLPDDGTLQFTFSYPASYQTQSLLLYWDRPNLWESVYSNESMTCKEKEALLDINNYQIFRLHPSYGICTFSGNDTIFCKSVRFKFKTIRERWWYIAVSNCDATNGMQMDYDVYMRNGEPEEFFREQFSADELYILEFNIAFFFVEVLMLSLVAYVSVKLEKQQMFHSTYKIFLASIIFFFASIIATCITYMAYASNGIDSSGAKIVCTALYATAQLLMILMLLLLGLGYTVVCGRLPHWGVICLSVFMSTFVVSYVALYIVEAATFDPALVLYRWESSPGYGLMAAILAAWVFYLGCSIFTMVKHKGKIPFYSPMLAFYTLWFIAIPVAVVVNMRHVPYHMRAKVVNFVEILSLFLAHLFYLVLTWPSMANKNFPFHIRTTQIDVISFDAATQRADEEATEDAKGSDLTGGGMFTDFSIFTVSDQRGAIGSTAPSAAVVRNGGGGFRGGGFGGGGFGGGGDNDDDSDSGVVAASPTQRRRQRGLLDGGGAADAAAVNAEADETASYPSLGDDDAPARLVEGRRAFVDVVGVGTDGENTAEGPLDAAAAPVGNESDGGDNGGDIGAEPAWLHTAAPSRSSGLLPPI